MEVRGILNSGPDGGSCPAVLRGPCRGFTGACSRLPEQFATIAVLPNYPNGLQDYYCHAFPDDNVPGDTLLVALIALAVGIPVTLFLAACFEIANDAEAPESWLQWRGWRLLVFGFKAHRQWHYTRDKPPLGYVRWYCRSAETTLPDLLMHMFHKAKALLTGTPPPWVLEARAAAAEAAMVAAPSGGVVSNDDDAASTSSSVRSAQALQHNKRVFTVIGLAGVLICWAIFTWFIFAYGMLIYELLGEKAEQSFAHSWGVSYGVKAAAEWKSIFKASIKAALVIAVLERAFLTTPTEWLEDAVDYYSLQSLMFNEQQLGFTGQVRAFFRFSKRCKDA